MDSGHPTNDGKKQRRKTVGGIQERSNRLGKALPKEVPLPASLQTSALRNSLYPTAIGDGKGGLFTNISALIPRIRGWLGRTGLQARPD